MKQSSPGNHPVKSDNMRRNELGDFLRSRRARLAPEALGLPAGQRRRTQGLRREEVAELAGIGVDWYIRLEQGRAVTPSATTVDALATALRLGTAEHAHLRTLTQKPNRWSGRKAFAQESVPAAIRRTVEGLEQPCYVMGRRWDLLAWNTAADELFAFSSLAVQDRNVLYSMLTQPSAKHLFGANWAKEARRMVAEFRTIHDVWATDPAFVDLTERIQKISSEFTEWWGAHDIQRVGAGQKTLLHPKKGALRFEYTSFQSNDDPSLKLVIYTLV